MAPAVDRGRFTNGIRRCAPETRNCMDASTGAAGEIGAVVVRRARSGAIAAGFERVLRPEPGPGELLIEPSHIGICGSDLEQLHGRMPATFSINFPHILGHEWVGRVAEVGSDAGEYSVGQRVLGHGHLGGNDWFGVTHDGAMADAFAVPSSMVFPVPDGVSDLTAALIEPFACVMQALKRLGGIGAGDIVHIHGLGTIGMCALVQAVTAGAAVSVFEPSELRRGTALALGAVRAFVPGTAEAETVRGEATIAIEASGHPAAMSGALESAGHEARVLFMGVSTPREHPARLGRVQAMDLTVMSSTGAPVGIWPSAIRAVDRAGIDLAPLVTSVLPFSECAEGIARAQNPSTDIKVLLTPAAAG
ncbi:alcohol dehydrogenase catalytic domain-containing protein [Leucobacter allii]|uniref:zinc-dependent alcohol dehydrogenase n=1 Tax=Leucobacter allii TaxID=2932247 RepID=UPI001FD22784|nr:alcohol dehydrogenase catalytic domain-containing protein [Leucobacter allii]UOR01365.1 alcohol dehydrogenase catalytic domain-containing protein [Leucobacter allii]